MAQEQKYEAKLESKAAVGSIDPNPARIYTLKNKQILEAHLKSIIDEGGLNKITLHPLLSDLLPNSIKLGTYETEGELSVDLTHEHDDRFVIKQALTGKAGEKAVFTLTFHLGNNNEVSVISNNIRAVNRTGEFAGDALSSDVWEKHTISTETMARHAAAEYFEYNFHHKDPMDDGEWSRILNDWASPLPDARKKHKENLLYFLWNDFMHQEKLNFFPDSTLSVEELINITRKQDNFLSIAQKVKDRIYEDSKKIHLETCKSPLFKEEHAYRKRYYSELKPLVEATKTAIIGAITETKPNKRKTFKDIYDNIVSKPEFKEFDKSKKDFVFTLLINNYELTKEIKPIETMVEDKYPLSYHEKLNTELGKGPLAFSFQLAPMVLKGLAGKPGSKEYKEFFKNCCQLQFNGLSKHQENTSNEDLQLAYEAHKKLINATSEQKKSYFNQLMQHIKSMQKYIEEGTFPTTPQDTLRFVRFVILNKDLRDYIIDKPAFYKLIEHMDIKTIPLDNLILLLQSIISNETALNYFAAHPEFLAKINLIELNKKVDLPSEIKPFLTYAKEEEQQRKNKPNPNDAKPVNNFNQDIFQLINHFEHKGESLGQALLGKMCSYDYIASCSVEEQKRLYMAVKNYIAPQNTIYKKFHKNLFAVSLFELNRYIDNKEKIQKIMEFINTPYDSFSKDNQALLNRWLVEHAIGKLPMNPEISKKIINHFYNQRNNAYENLGKNNQKILNEWTKKQPVHIIKNPTATLKLASSLKQNYESQNIAITGNIRRVYTTTSILLQHSVLPFTLFAPVRFIIAGLASLFTAPWLSLRALFKTRQNYYQPNDLKQLTFGNSKPTYLKHPQTNKEYLKELGELMHAQKEDTFKLMKQGQAHLYKNKGTSREFHTLVNLIPDEALHRIIKELFPFRENPKHHYALESFSCVALLLLRKGMTQYPQDFKPSQGASKIIGDIDKILKTKFRLSMEFDNLLESVQKSINSSTNVWQVDHVQQEATKYLEKQEQSAVTKLCQYKINEMAERKQLEFDGQTSSTAQVIQVTGTSGKPTGPSEPLPKPSSTKSKRPDTSRETPKTKPDDDDSAPTISSGKKPGKSS